MTSEQREKLIADVEALRLPHHLCDEDCWYSCPLSGQCCNDAAEKECNCGADTHNAKIDAIVTELRGSSRCL